MIGAKVPQNEKVRRGMGPTSWNGTDLHDAQMDSSEQGSG
jgi:hypothetical protein